MSTGNTQGRTKQSNGEQKPKSDSEKVHLNISLFNVLKGTVNVLFAFHVFTSEKC